MSTVCGGCKRPILDVSSLWLFLHVLMQYASSFYRLTLLAGHDQQNQPVCIPSRSITVKGHVLHWPLSRK